MQILPAIDLRGGQCVRLRQGDYNQETVFGDNPAEMAKRWADQGAEILHLVDLDGAKAGQPENLEAVRAILEAVDIPCQLGGGIRTQETIELLINDVGLSRVIVGTKALQNPEWFKEMTEKYPKQIVLGLDAKDSMVATEGWLDVSKTSALELAKQYADLDLAAIVYTNIANDGMMQGVDQQTIDDLCKLADLNVSVVASGGVSTLDDIENITNASKDHPYLNGIIIGRALYDGVFDVADSLEAVKKHS